MILVDYSSIMHRMIHSSVSKCNPKEIDGKYVTKDFIDYTKYLIFENLFQIQKEHEDNFGEMVICLDNSTNGYWRKDIYPDYKAGRRKNRDESKVNFGEVFQELDSLMTQIKLNLPWRVLSVPRAEADDIMLVLAKEFCEYEKILIHSPDKDMIQAQRDTENVFQYSGLTRKWLVPENKHDHMEHWITEHVCLGDASDEVPKVVDHTEFSGNFLKYLSEKGYNISTPMEFESSPFSKEEKQALFDNFNIFKTNRKDEDLDTKDIYKDTRFGPTTLQKAISKYGSVDAWLDSHPLYRGNYERNFKLVMEEGIPQYIRDGIIEAYRNEKVDHNILEFETYLSNNNLKSLIMEMPKLKRELTAADFGW
jgi:5'-3' exonuclease